MLLNNDQIGKLIEIIDYYTSFYISKHVGVNTLTSKDKSILKKFGIDFKIFSKNLPTMEVAFKFGMLAAALGKKGVKSMTLDGLIKFLKSGKFIALSAAEEFALNYVKTQSYNEIKGLGNRMSQDATQIFIEASKTQRIKYQKIISKEAQVAIKYRSTVKDLSSALGQKTQDWARDFDRIADYILHDAYQQGIATELLKEYGEDVKIYYAVYSKACEHCKRIYLINKKTNEPRVFKLKDVIANGSNIGRKTSDWKASVSPIHPWCKCTMHTKPENSIWNVEKQRFILSRNTYGVDRKSKIKITITKENVI